MSPRRSLTTKVLPSRMLIVSPAIGAPFRPAHPRALAGPRAQDRVKPMKAAVEDGEPPRNAGGRLIHCVRTGRSGRGEEPAVRMTVGLVKIDRRWTVMHEHHS